MEVKPTSSPCPPSAPSCILVGEDMWALTNDPSCISSDIEQTKSQGAETEAPWSVRAKGSCHLGKLRTHLASKATRGAVQAPSLSQQGEARCQDDNKTCSC